MSNKKYIGHKSSKFKWIATGFAIVLLGTAVAGIATSGDKDASPKNWFGGFFNNLIQEDNTEVEPDTQSQYGGATEASGIEYTGYSYTLSVN